MNRKDIEQRVRNILFSVLGIEIHKINTNTSPDTVDNWDSINHLNLMIAMEEEFDVEFSQENILKMITFEEMCTTVEDKLVEKD
jgi:acyl carrier protein|tara:strand:- start:211 stop:462 length:252 start_codon:yes stop_codon:yes gene_type:complete